MSDSGVLKLGHVQMVPGRLVYTVSVTISHSRSSSTNYITVTEVVHGAKDVWRDSWSWNMPFMPREAMEVALAELNTLVRGECEDRFGMQPRLTE